MRYGTMTVAFTALVVAAACGGSDAVSPTGVTNPNNPVLSTRSGNLNTQKDCSKYFGLAGDTCTITKSNLTEIGVGSVINYLQAANSDFTASGDVILDAGGSNKAFGHCTVERLTGTGVCVFNGGTGRFSFFSARVDVTPVGGVIDAWDGTYSFSR
ncbi:MAG: hypothetical protein ACJ770_15145 [Gemmatimonadaceae bacterium]